MKVSACALLILMGSVGTLGAQEQAQPPAGEATDDSVVHIPDLLPEAARPVVYDLLETLRGIEQAADAGELGIERVNPERERALAEAVTTIDDIVGDDPLGRAALVLLGVRVAEDLESPELAAGFLRRLGDEVTELPVHVRRQLELDSLRTGRALARSGEDLVRASTLIRPATVSPRQPPTVRSIGHYVLGRIMTDRFTALSYFDRAYLEASDGDSARQGWLAAMSALDRADAAAIELWASRIVITTRQEENRHMATTMALFSAGRLAPLLGQDTVRELFGEGIDRDIEIFANALREDLVAGTLASIYFSAAAMNAGWFDSAETLIATAEACINDAGWEEATGQNRAEHLAIIEQLRESNAAMRRGGRPTLAEPPVTFSIEIGPAVVAGPIKLKLDFRFRNEQDDEADAEEDTPLMI